MLTVCPSLSSSPLSATLAAALYPSSSSVDREELFFNTDMITKPIITGEVNYVNRSHIYYVMHFV